MKFKIKPLVLGIACAGLLTLHGCGGGGGTAVQTTVSGIAATGAAFEGATVEVTDITGNAVGSSAVVGQDGVYTITLAAGATAPFVLTATRTGAEGASETLVSVIASVTGTTATANITPITHLIAARLSKSGDPSKLGAELKGDNALLTASKVNANVAEVQKILEPILTATDTKGTNPLTDSFTVNGAGYDRLLDSIKISVIPDDTKSSNIEISIKQKQDDNAQPVAIQFRSADKVASVPNLPAIDNTKMVAAGTADLIKSFLARLTRCYALPLKDRVDSTILSGIASGTFANVKATECKNAFAENNPAKFLNNGSQVGRASNGSGAFATLFKETSTGAVFSQGSYEFTRKNGDVVAGYKGKDALGNETFDSFVLRLDADGNLKLIGNQYAFGGGVAAYQQRRTFPADPSSDYFSTGYSLSVPLIPGIAYVEVTTPKSNKLTLIPGSDGMVFAKTNSNGSVVPSGTSFVRIRSEYVDKVKAGESKLEHPAKRDTGLFFIPVDAEDSEISTYGNQSLWEFEYFNSVNVSQGKQSYKTRARANTISELRTRSWATLESEAFKSLADNFVPNTATAPSNNSYTKLPLTGLVQPGWTLPAGALPPTSITLFGKAGPNADGTGTKVNFNDAQSVPSKARTAEIMCTNGTLEKHCRDSGYTTGAIMTGLHLWAREPSGREYANFFATYKLN